MGERADSAGAHHPAPILLYGPTASGKSALALALAERLGGAVVNADSQQVYDTWRILTARPSAEDEARAPHFLYGHVPLDAAYSVGRWLGEVRAVLDTCRERGLVPIVTGGTGLYFRALTEGLAPIPAVPPQVRADAEAALHRHGLPSLAEELAQRDPETAAAIDLANPARVLRAWEVLEATGTPLARWQARTDPPLLPLGGVQAVALTPPRDWLHARCDARLDAMIADGALVEVEAVMTRGLAWSQPGMKAVGAAELGRHLRGEITLAEAVSAAKTATRRYAKRQLTWARGQMADWTAITATEQDTRLAALTGRLERDGTR